MNWIEVAGLLTPGSVFSLVLTGSNLESKFNLKMHGGTLST